MKLLFAKSIILNHYLPITLSYDRQIFMRDSGIAVLHIYSVYTVIEYTVVSIYYLKYQCWSENIKTANFQNANFIKQNGVTSLSLSSTCVSFPSIKSSSSVSENSEKSDNSLPISPKAKRTSLGSLISQFHNAILFYKVCSFKICSFNVL